MNPTHTCPECGKSLGADAPRGLCPKCLMGAAYSSTVGHGGASEGGTKPPSVAKAVGLDEFLRTIREMDLVADADLDRFLDSAAGDSQKLARMLVQSGKLTGYQAGAVLQGKAHGLAIGSYLVLGKLGVGGMGLVFKAKHRPSGRVVALKMLPPSFGRDREAVARFRREFQIASRLSHPNIVSAIEASEDRGVHFLTMDYIEGYDLERLVAEGGPMAIKLALHCVIQAARGLEAAHAQGVIHRDIKPGNLMIDASGAVRLLDLGLARVIEATHQLGKVDGTLTQTGTYMGTVDFLAPEQADDAKRADHRADIYSLGCTLYYIATGKPPFEGETVLKRLIAHQNRPAPPLRAARPEVSEAIEEIYRQMMEKRPDDRPQSISEVVIELEACRSSPREAGDASGDLKTFARTVMKRAQPRGRRGPDDSVYARQARTSGLKFDPDLRLEDLVADYRDEIHHDPLSEEKLPPIAYRPTPRPKRRRRNPAAAFFRGAGAALGLVVAAVFLLNRHGPDRAAVPVQEVSKRSFKDPSPPATEDDGGKFRPLFNGKDLSGWTVARGDAGVWSVEKGAIVGKGAGPDKIGVLISDREYADYDLRLQFAVPADANSGVYPLYVPVQGETGYEINILTGPNSANITGALNWTSGGQSTEDTRPERPAELRPAGSWNDMEISRRDGILSASINGRQTLKVDLGELARRPEARAALKRRKGPIGLQANIGTGRFRNVEIRDLTGESSALADLSRAREPSSKVPADAVPFRASRYKAFNEELTWHAAKARCEELGGHLAIVRTEAGQQFVNSLVVVAGLNAAWLGATDEGTEGRWVWVDGSEMAFNAWDLAAGQPNNKNLGEDYLLLAATRSGKWSDQPDRAERVWRPGFVCQWDGAAESVVAAPAKGRVLYSDNFDNPGSGWPSSSGPQYSRGYVGGRYRIDNRAADTWWYAGPPVNPPAEVACEIVGRIWGDKPDSGGFLIVNADYPDIKDYCRVRLHADGEVSLSTKSESLAYFKADQSHARTGPDAWNSVVLQIRKRTVEIFVNGVQLGDAVELPFTSTMKGIGIGNSCKVPNLRAELDRFEFREVSGGP